MSSEFHLVETLYCTSSVTGHKQGFYLFIFFRYQPQIHNTACLVLSL